MTRNKLPLAKSNKQRGVPFNSEDLQNAKAVAVNSSEAAEYLLMRVQQYVSNSGQQQELASAVANVASFTELTRCRSQRINPFNCDSPDVVKDGFETMQDNLAKTAYNTLVKNTLADTPIGMDVAVDKNSNLLRMYSQNNGTGVDLLNDEATAAMDTLFNSCISREDNEGNSMLCEDGVLYEADGENKIKDKKGNFVRANPEKIQHAMQETFPEFLAKLGAGDEERIRVIDVREHEYPSAEAEVKVEKTKEKVPEKAEVEEVSVEVEKQQPEAPEGSEEPGTRMGG